MPLSKDLFTIRRAALAAAIVAGVVAPPMALRALTAKPSATTVDVALRPVAATGTTTTTPAATTTVASGPGSANPFGAVATDAPSTAAAPTTVPPPPVTAPVVTTQPPPVTTTVPPPPSGPGSPTSYAFATYSSGANVDKSPIRWSRSAIVHYQINPANAPAGAVADLSQALQMLQTATGLHIVNDGPTTFSTDNAAGCTPTTMTTCWVAAGKATPLPDGTGGYPPILLGWSPATAPILASNASGGTLGRTLVLPRGTSTTPPSDFELVTGIVVFNSTVILPSGFGGSSRGAAMLHMLGALAGLATVSDPDQMMFPTLNGHLAAYGAGDLAGLKIAGLGVNYPVVPRV
jgi:hypothetical protein